MYIAEKEFEKNDRHFYTTLVHLHDWRHCDKCAAVTSLSSLVSPPPRHPSFSHRRVFSLKQEGCLGYSSGSKSYFLTQLFWLASVLTLWLTGQSVSSETDRFFSRALIQNLLITIALSTNISMALISQQHPRTPPVYSLTGIRLFCWEAAGVGKPMSRPAFWFIWTLRKDWMPVAPAWSKDTKVKFSSAAKRTKGYLGDTVVGRL